MAQLESPQIPLAAPSFQLAQSPVQLASYLKLQHEVILAIIRDLQRLNTESVDYEARLTALEAAVADHEARITVLEPP